MRIQAVRLINVTINVSLMSYINVSSTKKTLRLATWIIRELAANYREFFFIQYICLEIYEKFTVNSRKFV